MRTKVKKWFVKHGNTICAVAVSLASLSSLVIYYSYGDFRIPTGTKGSITNLIWENRTQGCNIPKANLHMERGQTNSLPIDTTGYWSPDSIGTYTIYG